VGEGLFDFKQKAIPKYRTSGGFLVGMAVIFSCFLPPQVLSALRSTIEAWSDPGGGVNPARVLLADPPVPVSLFLKFIILRGSDLSQNNSE